MPTSGTFQIMTPVITTAATRLIQMDWMVQTMDLTGYALDCANGIDGLFRDPAKADPNQQPSKRI
jgi:hypothetical protein